MTGDNPATSLREELLSGVEAHQASDAPTGADAPPSVPGDVGGQPAIEGVAPLVPAELPPLEAPTMWGKPYRDTFGKFAANPEYRELLENWKNQFGESEKYITQRQQQFADYQKRMDPIYSRLQPYEQYWAQQGLAPEQGLGQILSYAEALAQDPGSTLLQLAQMYEVNLQELFAEQPYQDPQVMALQQQIQQLQEAQSYGVQAQQQQMHTRVVQDIQAFQEAVDEQGKQKAPHFDRVYDKMLGLARGGMVKGIEEAYQMAVLLDPELQAEISQARALDEAAQKAAAAKKAMGASQTVQGKATTDGPPPSLSLRDELGQGLAARGFT